MNAFIYSVVCFQDDATKQLDILQREIQDAYEEFRDLEKVLKDLTKEIQEFNREKEEAEKRQTKAIKKQAELELDVKDLQERISRHIQAKVSNTNKEKNANYFFRINNAKCFYLKCGMLSR